MTIALIVATDKNRAIGYNNQMPWYLPADLKYFSSITMGHPIIMGRNTHEAIGKVLPGRKNFILSRDPSLTIDGAKVCSSFEKAVEKAKEDHAGEIMVIGGGTLYHQALPLASRIYLTHIKIEVAADTFFPILDDKKWIIEKPTQYFPSLNDMPAYEFRVYQRKN